LGKPRVVLSPADLLYRFSEVAVDVEFVVGDPDLGSLNASGARGAGTDTHDGVFDPHADFFRQALPKRARALLVSSFHELQHPRMP
jgi:hypothetical protein